MKKFLGLLLLLLTGYHLSSQSLFTRTYGSQGQFNLSRSLAISADSNFIMFGSTAGWGAVNGDMALVKTDTSGNTLWEHIYGNAATEEGVSVKALPDNGFILTGVTNESPNGDYNIRVIRTDALGDTIWTKTYGSSAWDIVEEIAVLSDGGFALAATTYEEPYNTGTFYLLRLDANGNLLWENRLNRGTNNLASSVDELPDGSLLLAGRGKLPGRTDTDILLVKYSPTGDTLWSKFYGDYENEWAADVAYSTDLRICLAGNKTQFSGNTREFLITVNENGTPLNVNDFSDSRQLEMQSVRFVEENNSFVFSANYQAPTVMRATVYRYTVLLDYLCSAPMNVLSNSYASEAIAVLGSYLLMTGTFNQVAPGVSSFVLMKTTMNCLWNDNVTVGLNETVLVNISPEIYPNPTEGKLHVDIAREPLLVRVTDLNGREVDLSFNYSDARLTIATDALEPGMYMLHLQHKNAPSSYHRFIRSR